MYCGVIGEQSYRDSTEGDEKSGLFFNEKWQINISFRFLFVSFSRSFTVSVCVSCLIIYMLRYAGQYDECMGRDGAKSVDIAKNLTNL